MRKKHALNEKQPGETAPEGLASTCSVLAVGLFMLTFVFQNFVIPSSSMASTLLVGDHVLVERETLAPAAKWAPFLPYRDVRRGDIIVFYKPTEERNGEHLFLVKRVIAVPGDHIHPPSSPDLRRHCPQRRAHRAFTCCSSVSSRS